MKVVLKEREDERDLRDEITTSEKANGNNGEDDVQGEI